MWKIFFGQTGGSNEVAFGYPAKLQA